MTRRMRLVVPTIAVAVAAAVWSYGVLWPASSNRRVVEEDSGAAGVAAETRSAEPAALAARHPLQTYLLAEASPERDSVLLSMVRDAGYPCLEVHAAMPLVPDAAAWRITCPDAHAYVIEIDASGTLRIDPLTYSEGRSPYQEPPILTEPPSPTGPRLPR